MPNPDDQKNKALAFWDSLDCINLNEKNSFTEPIIDKVTQEWEQGNKNSLIYIKKNKTRGEYFGLVIDKGGDIVASAIGEDFDSVVEILKAHKDVPGKLKIQYGLTYYNRLIWEDQSKNTLIRIKVKRGNSGKRRKKSTNKIIGEIITKNGLKLFEASGSTKTEIQRLLKKSRLISSHVAIGDKITYFNRIKKNVTEEMVYKYRPKRSIKPETASEEMAIVAAV